MPVSPADRVLHTGGAPARYRSPAARSRPRGAAQPHGWIAWHQHACGRAPGGRHPAPLQRASVEVIVLGVGDTELRSLVEQSRPSDASQPAPDPGVLVLTPRGHARYALQQLTGRELEVLTLMAEGRSNHAIASHLFVTEHTIEKHIRNIFAALRLSASRADHRRVLAVLTYLTAVATGAG